MYKIYIEKDRTKTLFYKGGIEDLALANVVYMPTAGSAGTLNFTVPFTHPYYSLIEPLNTDFWLYKNDTPIFRGRYVGSTEDFYRTGQISCEGDLNFLCDSMQEPFEFVGSIQAFFTEIINRHNAQVEDRKKFTIGTVNVVDENNYMQRVSDSYITTAEVIKTQLVEVHGGYVRVRHQNNINYIDYVIDYGGTNKQTIRFGENLIDIAKQIDATNIITCLYPLGASMKAKKYCDENVNAQAIQTIPKDQKQKPYNQFNQLVSERIDITTGANAKYLVAYYYSSSCEIDLETHTKSMTIYNRATEKPVSWLRMPREFTEKNPLIRTSKDAYTAYCSVTPNTTYTVQKIADKVFYVGWTDKHPEVGETYKLGERIEFERSDGTYIYEANRNITTPEVFEKSHWHEIGIKDAVKGAKSRLDIGLVNNGVKYIRNNDGISKWGQIWGSYEFDGVTDPNILLTKAKQYLEEQIVLPQTFTLTAVDLSLIDANVDDFKVGYWTNVVSNPQNIKGTYILTQAVIDISNPANSSVTLNGKSNSLALNLSRATIDATRRIQQIENNASQWITDAVANATDLIRGGLGGYVIMNTNDATGFPDEILIMDSPAKENAQNVIRLNKNGIGFSTSGYNGTYHNAWTIDGQLVADFITTGTMSADRMRGGMLSIGGSKAGEFKNGVLKVFDENDNEIGTWDTNGLKISRGVLTSARVQNAASGNRLVIDSSSSLKGYKDNELFNVINVSQSSSGNTQLTIDAKTQLNIRTPKLVVEAASHGMNASTGLQTITGLAEFECVTGKYMANEGPIEGQEIVEGHWALIDPDTGEITGSMYATLPAILKMQKKSLSCVNGMLVSKNTGQIYAL